MWLLDALAEERIAQAAREGEFDRLEGAGRPLALDEDPLVPEEERAALRILKNAGLVPPEVEQLRERGRLQALVAHPEAGSEAQRQAVRRLEVLDLRLRARGLALSLDARYADRVLARLGGAERE